LVGGQPTCWYFARNKRKSDVTGLTNPQVSGKFRDIKDFHMKKIATSNRRIGSPSGGQSRQLLDSLIGLLRRWSFLLTVNLHTQQQQYGQQ
jgi:hypothetical protein